MSLSSCLVVSPGAGVLAHQTTPSHPQLFRHLNNPPLLTAGRLRASFCGWISSRASGTWHLRLHSTAFHSFTKHSSYTCEQVLLAVVFACTSSSVCLYVCKGICIFAVQMSMFNLPSIRLGSVWLCVGWLWNPSWSSWQNVQRSHSRAIWLKRQGAATLFLWFPGLECKLKCTKFVRPKSNGQLAIGCYG